MTEQNAKIFRGILIGLGILCVFLLGSLVRIPINFGFFAIILALTIGLTIGYRLGAGKSLKFWKKDNSTKSTNEQTKK